MISAIIFVYDMITSNKDRLISNHFDKFELLRHGNVFTTEFLPSRDYCFKLQAPVLNDCSEEVEATSNASLFDSFEGITDIDKLELLRHGNNQPHFYLSDSIVKRSLLQYYKLPGFSN